jgi:hypothetical protein
VSISVPRPFKAEPIAKQINFIESVQRMKKAREMRASERIAIARLGNVRNIEKMKAPGDKNTQPRPFNLKIDEVNLLNLLTYFSVSGLI